MKKINLIGRAFGRLCVMGDALADKRGQAQFTCVCQCGSVAVVRGTQLRKGRCQSCGCLMREEVSRRRFKHGCSHSTTPEYRAWSAMRNRCSNNKPQYRFWYGRGIRVCERWQIFENFLADMGLRPSNRHSLDRVNVDGDYEPGNVRWATISEQQNNKRSNVKLVVGGVVKTVGDVAKETGLKPVTICQRLRAYGFTAEDAASLPLYSRPKDRKVRVTRTVKGVQRP